MTPLPDLATCKKVGFIVPSSNTAVEPITTAVFQSLHTNIICIFTRIQVRTLGTSNDSTSQFATETMVAAARLLADAKPDAILWQGTSGMWVGQGLEGDRKLAKAMQDATGIPCSTNTLATIEALELLKIKRVSIAVPYTQDLTMKVKEFFVDEGWEVTGAEFMRPPPASNHEIAQSTSSDMKTVIKQAAENGPQAILVACTNWPAAALVDELEEELKVTVIDSIVVTAWQALRMVGVKESVRGWGKLMSTML